MTHHLAFVFSDSSGRVSFNLLSSRFLLTMKVYRWNLFNLILPYIALFARGPSNILQSPKYMIACVCASASGNASVKASFIHIPNYLNLQERGLRVEHKAF